MARQVDLVEQMIAQRVQSIVLAPADSKALVPVAVHAQQAGIVIVNIDNRLDAAALRERGVAIPFVGPDNRKGAEQVATFVASRLHGGGAGGDPRRRAQCLQRRAAQARIRGRHPAGRPGAGDVAVGVLGDVARQPGGGGDARRASGPAGTAVRQRLHGARRGRRPCARRAARRRWPSSGFDNISAVRPLLDAGRLVATADQHADQLAVFGIEYALEIRRSRKAPADRETPVDLVTR